MTGSRKRNPNRYLFGNQVILFNWVTFQYWSSASLFIGSIEEVRQNSDILIAYNPKLRSMCTYHFLEHTADIRIRLDANTIGGLFQAGVLSLAEILKPGFCTKQKEFPVRAELKVESLDSTALLVDFLSDILTLCHTNQVIYCKVEVQHLSETDILAKLFGSPVDRFEDDIKAVTYHEAEVRKNKSGGWSSMIIVDI